MAKPTSLAALGGAYGNVAALAACVAHARENKAETLAFLGDAIGCCAHSEEVMRAVKRDFSVLVAGNHEEQAAAGSDSCGCGYASPEDEEISCEAFRLATEALSPASKEWLGTWPKHAIVELAGGRVLLCHGSPGNTNEFLYEAELDDLRVLAWLEKHDVRGFVCTHSGLPFVRELRGGRFAVNCGAVGKPDHDGDPAVHYARIDLPASGAPTIAIERVTYDHEAFAKELEQLGVADVFVSPLRTGVWTSGVASLPPSERHRHLRAHPHARPVSLASAGPERLEKSRFRDVLAQHREMKLVSAQESDEIMRALEPDFPFYAAMRLADSMHVHVKVDNVDRLPRDAFLALGGGPENERHGYAKFSYAGGINMIFSSIDIAEEDLLPEPRSGKPFVDHLGIDLRRETGVSRARFDEIPALAQRTGWIEVAQGGRGRAVHCCHVQVGAKHWVYPPAEGTPFTLPVELAYGPLVISAEEGGCDLRPIDPRHPAAPDFVACTPEEMAARKLSRTVAERDAAR